MKEAVELRRSGIRRPILILGYTSPALYEKALDYDITLTVFQPDRIRMLSALAVERGKRARVHFAVDTGMSRIGWEVSERSADEVAEAARLPGIEAEGIFSHLRRRMKRIKHCPSSSAPNLTAFFRCLRRAEFFSL